MVTTKQIERISKMFTDAINRHGDDLRYAELRWDLVETFDSRYPDALIQTHVPWVYLDFK